jgi:hypothetical protein
LSKSSVSVLRQNAPISSIHSLAGKPIPIPQAFRSADINSSFGNGFGAATLTNPVISSDQKLYGTREIRFVNPGHILAARTPRPTQSHSN